MSSDRVSFFGFADDKLYYDEKRKRFVNTANASGFVHRQYYQNHFKDVSYSIDHNFASVLSNAPISTAKRRKSSR